jgi:hypothetical protein
MCKAQWCVYTSPALTFINSAFSPQSVFHMILTSNDYYPSSLCGRDASVFSPRIVAVDVRLQSAQEARNG